MKKVCELCGFADDSFTIEENGEVLKVCKFCHDGYLERTGQMPEKPIEQEQAVPDLEQKKNAKKRVVATATSAKSDNEPPPFFANEADAKKAILDRVGSLDDDEDNSPIVKLFKNDATYAMTLDKQLEDIMKKEPKTIEIVENVKGKSKSDKKDKSLQLRADVSPRIDDERISITSPEVMLEKDARPKTNLDVTVLEYENAIRFSDAFKLVYHKLSYTIILVLITLAVSTVLAITQGWKNALVVLGTASVAVALSFVLMWFLQTRYHAVRRTLLLRIRQQEILFETYHGDCYRELKTKYTIIKALSWLFFRLSVIIPILVITATIILGIIGSFLYYYWLFSVSILAAILAGIFVYWFFKFINDCINIVLDAEKNQQLQQQTLLDILAELRKK